MAWPFTPSFECVECGDDVDPRYADRIGEECACGWCAAAHRTLLRKEARESADQDIGALQAKIEAMGEAA